MCVRDKISRLFKQKIFQYMAKLKQKEKLGNHSNSKNNKVQKGEILLIPSLTQCNSYIIICQFQLSESKKGINNLSNCNKVNGFSRIGLPTTCNFKEKKIYLLSCLKRPNEERIGINSCMKYNTSFGIISPWFVQHL